MKILSYIGLSAFLLLNACKQSQTVKVDNSTNTIRKQSQIIIEQLDSKNYSALIDFIHPQKGLYFSPYTYVQKDRYPHVSKGDYRSFIKPDSLIYWGEQDGTGDSILLNFHNYSDKYIYRAKYLEAEHFSIDSIMGKGNTINNIKSIFPNATIVEYHFPGLEPKYQGMDWCSLRLVFEEFEQKFYLVAIVNDQWTI